MKFQGKSVAFILVFLTIFSCKRNETNELNNAEKNQNDTLKPNNKLEIKDSLRLIKDTTLLGNSSQGTKVNIFVDLITNDTVFKINEFGEMGNNEIKFIANKILKIAEKKENKYVEPIYINSDAKISKTIIKKLDKSKEELTKLYFDYKNLFKKDNNLIKKWIGEFQSHFEFTRGVDDYIINYKISVNSKANVQIQENINGNDSNSYKLFVEKVNLNRIKFKSLDDNEVEFILNKNNDKYSLSGQTVYMLNPPNQDYEVLRK